MSNFKELEKSVSSDPNEMYIESDDDTLSIIQQIRDDGESLMSEVFDSMIEDNSYSNFGMFDSQNSHIRIIDGYINLDEPTLINYDDDGASVASHNDFSYEDCNDEVDTEDEVSTESLNYNDYEPDTESMDYIMETDSYDTYESIDTFVHYNNTEEYDNNFQRIKEVATSTVIVLGTLLISVILGI